MEFLGTKCYDKPKLKTTLMVLHCKKKSSFRLSVSSVNVTKSADSVTFTKEILNGILDFLCSAPYSVLEASHRYPAFYKKVLHDF